MAVLLYSAFASALLVPGGPAAVARGRAAVRMAALPFGAPLATLLEQHRAEVDELASRTASERGADENESWLLRFVLESESVDDAVASVNKVLQWRRGEGKPIVDAAAAAYEAATAGGGWNNEAAIGAAPNAAVICKYLKASQIQTIPDPQRGYLIYVIRASAIEDKALMSEVSQDELSDFFVFAKELNGRVALARSEATGKLIGLVTANDLSGISLTGSGEFRSALSLASKRTAPLYPGIAGPTLLLNLPPLLSALVGLFKPIFPKKVQEKLKFESGPLKKIKDLEELLQEKGGAPNERRLQFLNEIGDVLAA